MLFLSFIFCAVVVSHALAAEAEYTCPYDYTAYDDMCYRLHYVLVANYEGALRVCRSEGGDLVSIHDAFINTFLRYYGKPQFLTGLRYDQQNGVYAWSDGSPLDYTSYADGFIANRDSYGYCAKSSNGKWTNAECETDKLQYVCHKKAHSYMPTSPYSCSNESTIRTVPDMILSPGYPSQYALNSSASSSGCPYQLLAATGNYIKVRFEEISVNNSAGRILVYNGWIENPEYEIARADDDFVDGEITIANNRAMVRLLGSGPGKWKITWDSFQNNSVADPLNTVCPSSSTIQTQSGRILSPGYPQSYDFPSEVSTYGCFYKLYSKEGAPIKLLFEELNFQSDQGAIEIYRGWKQSAANKIQTIYKKDEGTELKVPYDKVLMRVLNTAKGTYRITWSAPASTVTTTPMPTTTTVTAAAKTTVTTATAATVTTAKTTAPPTAAPGPSFTSTTTTSGTIIFTTVTSITTDKNTTTTRIPTTGCDYGGSVFGGSCYLPGPLLLGESQAEEYCATHGGHLASIHSQTEQNFIDQNFFPGSAYWIGAECSWMNAKEHNFYLDQSTLSCNWTDGSPFDYSNWMDVPSVTSMACTLGNFNGDNTGTWANYYCTASMNFLCKYRL